MKRKFSFITYCVICLLGLGFKANAQCTVDFYETDGSDSIPAIYASAYNPLDSNALYTYLWSDGSTDPYILNPTIGANYCVTVTGGGCTASDCYTFIGCYLQPNPPATVDLYGVPGDVFTVQLGSNVTGGTAPYTYEWFPDPNISNLTIENPTATVSSNYACFTVKVSDVDGCFAYETSCFNVVDTSSLFCTATILETTDSAGNTFLSAYPYDDSSYVYFWSDGSNAPAIPALIAGHTYCVTIFFPDGCIADECYLYDSTTVDPCQVNIIPSGPSGGQLVAQPAAVGNYLFEWNTGETTNLIDISSPGIYCVTMTDSISGCTASDCFVYDTTGSPDCAAAFVTYYHIDYPNDVFLINVAQGSDLFYFWDFGDGNTSTDSFPTHTYASYGCYNVCLSIVTADSSCNAIFCDTVCLFSILPARSTSGFTLNVIRNLESLGIQETSAIESLSIYPNPAQDEVFLELNAKKSASALVEVKDLTGRVVKAQAVAAQTGLNQIQIDVLDLEVGMYFLTYTQNQEVKTVRFLKQ
jgi:hypothetical protein